MPENTMRRLPVPALLLLLCSLVDGASAAVVVRYRPETTPLPDLELREARPGSVPLALATTTVPFRVLNVVSWPLPTGTSPPNPHLRRSNTVCGYIGGNPDLPATCSAGSHCVLDSEHNAVGCCPDGSDSCTAGVYTGCVDGDAATDSNPYVYTCSSGSYCYKNDFGAGYYQYGCGAASTLGQSVAAAASGKVSLALSSERVTFTGTYTAATEASSSTAVSSSSPASSTPSSLSSSSLVSTSSISTSSSASSTVSSSSFSSSSSSSSSTAESSSASSTTTSATSKSSTSTAAKSTSTHNSSDPSNLDNTGSGKDRAGVIIGATISGVAGLIALVSLAIFCVWKRRKARRDGYDGGTDGSGGFANRKQTTRGPPGFRSSSGNFQALHSNPEDFETGLEPEMIMAMPKPPSSRKARGFEIGGPYNAVHVAGTGSGLGTTPLEPYQTPEGDTWATPAVGGAVGTAVTASVAVTSPRMSATARNNSVVSRQSSKNSNYNYGPGGPSLSRAISSAASDGGRVPPPQTAYQELSPYEGAGPGDGLAQHPLNPYVEGEQAPLTHTYDDFARGYNQEVLSLIGEEDEDLVKSVRNSVAAGVTLRESYNHAEHAEQHDLGDESETLPQSSLGSRLSGDISTTMSSSGTRSGTNSATNSQVYGTERDSSGVLPLSQQPLNLRGGAGSSFSGSTEELSLAENTKNDSHNDNHADHADEADQTEPIGPDPDNTGAYSAMLSAGPPPKSMRPLWQQNRQKTRNLMWS
ncbi:hypothetical protein F503_03928 [Ophiostoma piceae UAMH 11346]|uniref:Uncharacterized protein n=1 Tax=Ophiostoma piceae (strain UAMH 11346) TaxID=1262450 RepID=S3C827_OPHP1|nr:hypothetical protein F503_03928 [Ophiostoma piceae UAMH 11346]